MTYLDELLNRNDVRLDYYDQEGDKGVCPLCKAGVVRVWYITALNSDGDYLESLTSDKCDNENCGFEHFYLDREDI